MDGGVSYLISLYNKQDYIEKTLAAVHGEWQITGGEIIVYDDVSTDRSVDLVRRLPFAGDITLILGEKNGGCVYATDRLIAAARHPYVRFVDGDDLVLPGSTAAMLELVRREGCTLLFGRLATIGGDVAGLAAEPPHAIDRPLRFILRNTAFNPSALLVVTEALKRVYPLPVQLRHSQDFIIGLRLALLGERFHAYGAVVALAPPEDDNRLSRHMAEMFGNMAETVALETEGRAPFPLADLRYATARYASRCLRYFRRVQRSGPRRLSVADMMWLYLITLRAAFASAPACRRDLTHIAGVFYRDRGHILKS